jgi:hypothetical protein
MRPSPGLATLTIVSAAALLGATALPAAAQAPPARRPAAATRPAATTTPRGQCRVEGVWDLESRSRDERDEPLEGYHQRKVLTRNYFVWIGEDAKRDTITLRTVADTLRAQRSLGGSGKYRITGNAYSETLDYFTWPEFLGKTLHATCRVVGDRWHHTYTDPWDTTGVRTPIVRVTEIWRRIE